MRQLDLLVAGRAEKVPGVQEPLGPPFGPPIASRLAPYRLGGSPGGRDAESTKASRVAHQQGAFIKLTWQLGKPVRWVNRLDVPADCAESTSRSTSLAMMLVNRSIKAGSRMTSTTVVRSSSPRCQLNSRKPESNSSRRGSPPGPTTTVTRRPPRTDMGTETKTRQYLSAPLPSRLCHQAS